MSMGKRFLKLDGSEQDGNVHEVAATLPLPGPARRSLWDQEGVPPDVSGTRPGRTSVSRSTTTKNLTAVVDTHPRS